ncbi:ATP-binding protein [Marinicella sp. W31]|uniref:ATP-binding protein n=1 Tax=Marinicella sp. W31 TaxID=3023713 RepID=UPI0037572CCF
MTLLVGRLVSEVNNQDKLLHHQIAEKVALDMMELIKTQSISDQLLRNRYVLDYGNTMQIYLINPQGKDVLQRPIPKKINLALNSSTKKNMVFFVNDLNGYKVIGYQKFYPVWRTFLQPGGRLILLITALVFSALISYGLSRFVVMPVKRIRDAGQKVAAGDLSVRVAHTVAGRQDDIALLARDFDVMTERVAKLLSNQQRLMRDVSHELRSPLARLQAMFSIQRQRNELAEEKNDDSLLLKMEIEAERLNNLIEEILKFVRLDVHEEISKHKTDLVDLIVVIAEDAMIEWNDDGKDVTLRGEESCILDVDSAIIHSALENVIRNAFRYTKSNSHVTISVNNTCDGVLIEVSDQGPGVPEGSLKSLFEPFFRVEESRTHQLGGGGLGLAIAERSILLHQGKIHAENNTKGGLKVIIWLPR